MKRNRGLYSTKCLISGPRRALTAAAAFLCFFALAAVTLDAAYEGFGLGARTLASGGAATAVGDDIYAPAVNPAGLAYLKRAQMAFEYGRLYLNLSDGSDIFNGFIAVAYPFIKSEITDKMIISSPTAASPFTAITSSEHPRADGITPVPAVETGISRTLAGAVMLGYRAAGLSGHYSENIANLTYARFFGRRLAAGVSVKALGDSFASGEYIERSPVFDYGSRLSKTSVTGDIGFIWNPLPRFFVGAAALDFTEPDIGYIESDRLAATYRFGVGMRKSDSRFGFDASYAPRAKNIEISSGFERKLGRIASARAGLVYGRLAAADSWRISTGMGFEISDSIALDYAVAYPLTVLKNTYGSHWISFVFRFGKAPPDEIEPGSLERAYQELGEEKFRLESRLAQTEAEKRRLEEVLIEESTVRIRERIKQAREAARAESSRSQDKAKTDTPEIRGVAGSRAHIVQRGDTLQSLAEKYYKDSKLWIEIYNANRDDIGRGGALKVNQVLVIPPQGASRAGVPSAVPAPSTVVPAAPPPTPSAVPEAKEIAPVVEAEPPAPLPSPTAPPLPAKERPAVKPKAASRLHTVIPGENLRSIAAKYYNDPEKWRVILDANKDKIVRGRIIPGAELAIP